VVVQGYGNAGSVASRLLHERGLKVIGASDSTGAIVARGGLDPAALEKHKTQTGSVKGFPGTEPIGADDLLALECEVLVPAALENAITKEMAPRVRARVVAEAANGPTTPGADAVFKERGIMVIPDILCNAGGVTVSYFEWVQGLQAFFWDEAEVNSNLDRIMKRAFAEVHKVSTERRLDMRTAAYVLAVDRVAQATKIRGLWP
jgi:glutamate dehydrogenase/leucine dehydrogenase